MTDPLIPLLQPETLVTVVNRETMEAHYGVSGDLYNPSDYLIDPDFSGIQSVDWAYVAIEDDELVEVTAAGKTQVDDAQLAAMKTSKCREIDRRTVKLIQTGFQHLSKRFSLSEAAQAKLSGVNQIREHPAVTYPIRWNTWNDDGVYEVPDADDMLVMYLTAVGTYRAHVDSGTVLKDLVRAAATSAEVEAVADDR